MRAGGERGSARNLLVGAALLALGAGIGIVLGSTFDAPALLGERVREPVQTVELPAEPAALAEDLEEYRALQREAPPEPPPVAAPPAASPPAAAAPDVPAAPAASSASETYAPAALEAPTPAPGPPGPAPAAPKPTPAPAPPEPRAEEVIGAIAATHKSPAPAGLPEPKPAPEQAGAPAPAGVDRVIQVGAYQDPERANRVVAQLRELGFDSYVSKTSAPGPYPHRVRVRPKAGRNAGRVAVQLQGHGYDVWVTRE